MAVNAGGINGENADLNADVAELWIEIGIIDIFFKHLECEEQTLIEIMCHHHITLLPLPGQHHLGILTVAARFHYVFYLEIPYCIKRY